jgi:alpha-L-fucosidase
LLTGNSNRKVTDVEHTAQPEKEWFDRAGLGLFVCPSIASVDGTIEIGWGMMGQKEWDTKVAADIPRNEVTPEEYFALADEFDPDQWNPDGWLAATARAGFEYTVFVTKHHDGFALWPSEYGEFSTDQYLEGRDLVGEFVDACRRHDIRIGLYFSLPDWHHADFPRPGTLDEIRASNPEGMGVESYERRTESGQSPSAAAARPRLEDAEELLRFERYYRHVKGQVRELLTRYGDIDLLWFDLPIWPETLDHRMESLYQFVRATHPGIVVNGRTHGYEELGDYHTPENVLPEAPLDGWWELCQVWAPPAWAYTEAEQYREFDWTLERIAETVARGGNIALNVAPKPDGELPEGAYERLDELADWMSHSGAAVKGVNAGPWPARAPVPVTRRTGVWYVHVVRDHEGPVRVREVPEPVSVGLLRTGESVGYDYYAAESTVEFTLDAGQRASGNEVVAVTFPPDHHPLV